MFSKFSSQKFQRPHVMDRLNGLPSEKQFVYMVTQSKSQKRTFILPFVSHEKTMMVTVSWDFAGGVASWMLYEGQSTAAAAVWSGINIDASKMLLVIRERLMLNKAMNILPDLKETNPLPKPPESAPRGARLGEILVGSGLVKPDALDRALKMQSAQYEKVKLGELLVRGGHISPSQLEAAVDLQEQVKAQKLSMTDAIGDLGSAY